LGFASGVAFGFARTGFFGAAFGAAGIAMPGIESML
jgi:hypothetical protein